MAYSHRGSEGRDAPSRLAKGLDRMGRRRLVGSRGLMGLILASLAWSALSTAQAQIPRPAEPGAVLPPPDQAVAPAVRPTDYRIVPADTLEISVFGVEDLTRTVQVDVSGQINYPLIGGLMAWGKTPRVLADEIAAKLGARYLQSPQVDVFVKTSPNRNFTVEGAVASPGVFDLQGEMTLLQAIATAKGVTENASVRKVIVFRTIDGQRRAGVADLRHIRSGKVADPRIYPGDLIVVENTSTRRWLRDLMSVTPLFYLFGL